MNTSEVIKKIQQGLYIIEDLNEFLEINNVFVLSNTMKEIVKLKYNKENIINRLMEISEYRKSEHVLIGVYTVGHLAIATLLKLGFKKDELSCYKNLDNFNKNIVDKLVEGYEYVI